MIAHKEDRESVIQLIDVDPRLHSLVHELKRRANTDAPTRFGFLILSVTLGLICLAAVTMSDILGYAEGAVKVCGVTASGPHVLPARSASTLGDGLLP